MRGYPRILAAALLAGLAFAPAAHAQSEADFVAAFAGDWQTFDPAYAGDSANCAITLSDQAGENRYALTKTGCGGALQSVAAWGIVSNQLALVDGEDNVVVTLGGNQNRMTGDLVNGQAIIFERVGTQSAAISGDDIGGGACLYLGYTASCAERTDLTASFQPDTPGETVTASVLVDLNARSEARPDAAVSAVIPKNTCVAIEQCVEASDGRWCEATVETTTAWIRQQAVRSGRWPVLTYKAGC